MTGPRIASSLIGLGLWSSIAVAIFSMGFSVPALLGATGVLPYPWDPVLPDASSLLLAMAFIVMMTCLSRSVPWTLQHWTAVGHVFAVMYAVLVSIVYFVTLTVVVPMTQQGRAAEVQLLAFDERGSLMQALDGLGYFFLCVATFVAAFAFPSRGPQRWLRRVFLINGILGIPILLSYMPLVIPWSRFLLPINAFWILSVPACGVLAARYFRGITTSGFDELPAIQ